MLPSYDQLIAEMTRAWDSTRPSPHSRLLRVALLRELTRQIHTLRSELLATGGSEIAQILEHRESYLSRAFDSLDLPALSLEDVLSAKKEVPVPAKASAKAPEISSELAALIEPAKLTRQDRRWEATIASEALARRWSFWNLEASVEIHQVEAWAKNFSSKLWPHGVVLFVESDGFLQSDPSRPDLAFWQGKWTLVLEPETPDPREVIEDPQLHWTRL